MVAHDEKLPLLSPADKLGTEQLVSTGTVDGSTFKVAELAPAKPALFAFSATALIIMYYAACSSTMLIINKVTIYNLPAPTFVLLCQLIASVVSVKFGAVMGWLEADAIEWDKIRKFIWVVFGFLGTIFANIKVLQHANVETFITFRSSTPLVLSLCDWFFLGRALPNTRSWMCLLVLVAASVGYVVVDDGFKVDAYYWLCVWYVFFTVDSVYVKHMCDTVKMSNWGRVYYTNLLAVPPLLLTLPILSEHVMLAKVSWDANVLLPLLLSCMVLLSCNSFDETAVAHHVNLDMYAVLVGQHVNAALLVGVCMSHASYLLRDAVSATLFTIVGILCKIVTVMINYLIWDKHGSMEAIGCLLICVLAGTFYQQAPKRSEAKPVQPV